VSTVKRIKRENVAINTIAATQLSGKKSLPIAPGCYRVFGRTINATLLKRNNVNHRGLNCRQLNFIFVTEQMM